MIVARYAQTVTPSLPDHIITGLLVLVVPWLVLMDYRKLVRAVESQKAYWVSACGR